MTHRKRSKPGEVREDRQQMGDAESVLLYALLSGRTRCSLHLPRYRPNQTGGRVPPVQVVQEWAEWV